jgi:hypothetical protein
MKFIPFNSNPCPQLGDGGHAWAYHAACSAVEAAITGEEVIAGIEPLVTRDPNPASEIKDPLLAVRRERRNGATEAAATIKPETYRLPRPGQRDPFFGLPRTTYYELEKAGTIRLIRLRKRGYQRGTTLIPYDQVLAHVRGLTAEGK